MKFFRKIFFILIAFESLSSSAQKRVTDSLLLQLSKAKNDSIKCTFLYVLIDNESDNTIWPTYNAQLKAIAEKKTKEKRGGVFFLEVLSDAITNEGVLKQQNGKFSEALSDYRKSLEIKFDIHDRAGVADNLVNIGYIYFAAADYSKAADYYQKCLKIREELKDKAGSSLVLVNLGNVFLRQNDTVKFLDFINVFTHTWKGKAWDSI